MNMPILWDTWHSARRAQQRRKGAAIHAAAAIENPNLALYAAVCEAGGGHSHYNALLRRLVSFMRAAEQVLPRRELVERAGFEPAKAGL